MRKLDFYLLKARPLNVQGDRSGRGGRGTKIIPGPHSSSSHRQKIAPGLYLTDRRGGRQLWVLCLWQAWFEMQVLYNLVDLSLSFLIWVMNQHIRFVMKLKKDNVIHAWPIIDAQ